MAFFVTGTGSTRLAKISLIISIEEIVQFRVFSAGSQFSRISRLVDLMNQVN